MVKKREQNKKTAPRESLNVTENPPIQARRGILLDNSWPSSRSIRVSESMLHVLDIPSTVRRKRKLLNYDSSTRSLTMSPRTLYMLENTFRASPVRRSVVPVHVDASSELSETVSPEVPESAFRRTLRPRIARRVDTKCFESALVNDEASKPRQLLAEETSLDDSVAEFNSPILSQPFQWRKRTRKSKPGNTSVFKKALEQSFSQKSLLSSTKLQNSTSVEEEPESPNTRPRFIRRKQIGGATPEFKEALVESRTSKSRLTADLSSQGEEEEVLNSPLSAQHIKRKHNSGQVDPSAFKDAFNDSGKSSQHLRMNSRKLQDSASIEEEPESPQGRNRFASKRRIAATRPEFEKALVDSKTSKSHLAADSSSQEEEEEEEVLNSPLSSQHIEKKKKKSGQVDPSAFKDAFNDSGKSSQRLRMNSSKRQDSASSEEEPESPQGRNHFVSKRRIAAIRPEFEEALVDSRASKSRLTADLSSQGEEEEESNSPLSAQRIRKKEKSREVDPSAFKDAFNDSGKSSQRLRMNSSKRQDSASIEEEPESPQGRNRFASKRRIAATRPEFEKALVDSKTSKSHLAADSSSQEEEEEEEVLNSPLSSQHIEKKKKKSGQVDPSAFKDAFNDSGKSSQRLRMNSSKRQDSASSEEEPESPQGRNHFVSKRRIAAIRPEFEEALVDSRASKSRLTADLSSQGEEEEESNSPLSAQRIRKKQKSREVDPSAFKDAFNDSGKSSQRLRMNSSKRQDSASIEEEPESPQGRNRFASKRRIAATRPEFEKALVDSKTSKSHLAADSSSQEEEEEEEVLNSPLSSQDIEKKKKKSGQVDPSAFKDAFNDSGKSSQRLRMNSSKRQDSASSEEEPESPQGRNHFVSKRRIAAIRPEFEEALVDSRASKSRLTADLSSQGEEEEESNSPLSAQRIRKKEKSREVDPSAFKDAFNDSGKSSQRLRMNSSKRQDSASIADEPESPQGRNRFASKRRIAATRPEFEEALVENRASMSDLSSQGEEEEEELNSPLSAQHIKRKQKSGQVDASTFKDVFNDSGKSSQHLRMNPSKHQDSASIEEEPESPQGRNRFASKRRIAATRPEFEEALVESSTSKPQLNADLSSGGEEEKEQNSPFSPQHIKRKQKSGQVDPSAFKDAFNESGKSSQHLRMISSKYEDNATVEEEPESPKLRPHFYRKKQVTTMSARAEFQVAFDTFESTSKSPLYGASSPFNHGTNLRKSTSSSGKNQDIHETSNTANSGISASPNASRPFKSKERITTNANIVLEALNENSELTPSRIIINPHLKDREFHEISKERIENSGKISKSSNNSRTSKRKAMNANIFDKAYSDSTDVISDSTSSLQNLPERHFTALTPKQRKDDEMYHSFASDSTTTKDKEIRTELPQTDFMEKENKSVKEALPDTLSSHKLSIRTNSIRKESALKGKLSVSESAVDKSDVSSYKSTSHVTSFTDVSKTAPRISISSTKDSRNVNLRYSQNSNRTGENSMQSQTSKNVSSRTQQHSEKIENSKENSVQHSAAEKVNYKQQTLEAGFSKQVQKLAPHGTLERRLQLQEIVKELKKKSIEELKAKETTAVAVSLPQVVEIPETIPKKPVNRKPVSQWRMVNGKVYSSRLKKPQPWCTRRLYKLLIQKCGEKFGELKAYKKAEEFMIYLSKHVSTVVRRKKLENYKHISDEVKRALYRLGIIKSLMDYFLFIEDYLPFDYRVKVIECQRAYGLVTGIPIPPGTDLFADLNL